MADAAAPPVVVGVVAAPGAAAEVAQQLVVDLADDLADQLPSVAWKIAYAEDGLVRPPADDTELVTAARRRLLAEDWDLTICLTDLPLTSSGRPVAAHASPVHGVALISLPALGPVGLRRRTRTTAMTLIRTLAGETDEEPGPDGPPSGPLGRRLRELATETDAETDAEGVRFTARVLSGNLRLLLGMVRANRPWRLAARLSRALTATIAAGVFALVTSDIWRLADALGWARMTAVAAGSVLAIGVTLIVGAELWERAADPRVRKQVALFNLATTATVAIGVISMYAALFVLALPIALLLVVPGGFADALGHPVGAGDYLQLAWLTSSLGTVGGALGAGLESDEAVREAAYTYRPNTPAD
jgi:hypothetical protein